MKAALTKAERVALRRAIGFVEAGEMEEWTPVERAALDRAGTKLDAPDQAPALSAATARLLRDIAGEIRSSWAPTCRTDWCIEIPKTSANALLRRIDRALAREGRKGKS